MGTASVTVRLYTRNPERRIAPTFSSVTILPRRRIRAPTTAIIRMHRFSSATATGPMIFRRSSTRASRSRRRCLRLARWSCPGSPAIRQARSTPEDMAAAYPTQPTTRTGPTGASRSIAAVWSAAGTEPSHARRPPEMERQLARPVMRSGLGAEALSGIGWASDARGTEVASKPSRSTPVIIVADAHRLRGVAKIEDFDPTSSRAVAEYLSVRDEAAFGPLRFREGEPARRA